MAELRKTLIMKFGGKSVETPERFSQIGDLIMRRLTEFPNIVIVVSAMGKMTDELIALATAVNPNPPRREYDMLVSAGERISIALLAMALAKKGREAISFTGSQSGIITTDLHTEARILDVRPDRLIQALDAGKVVIVAGFQGVSLAKDVTTLGRGGSDTTAVALGVALGACHVEFYKDVLGIYDADPKNEQRAQLKELLTYDEALDIVHLSPRQVLHPRAIALARLNGLPLHVRSFIAQGMGTVIGLSATPRSPCPSYELELV